MENRKNYNEIMSFIKKEAKDTEKQGYFVYNIKDFLIEIEENLLNGNSKIANQIYENEIDFKTGDNTYNYCSNINNDIDYRIYEIDNQIYIKLKVHKFGDIRTHYTEDIILKFDSENEFYDLLNDNTMFYATVYTEAGEVFLDCDIFSDTINVELNDKNDNYISADSSEIDFTIYNTINEITEKLNKYFSNAD